MKPHSTPFTWLDDDYVSSLRERARSAQENITYFRIMVLDRLAAGDLAGAAGADDNLKGWLNERRVAEEDLVWAEKMRAL